MRPYEMMIVLAPDVPEDELDPLIDTIESYVTRLGGDVIAVNRDSPWGRRRLAYPIRHQGRDVRDGFYALYYMDVAPNSIVEIEREIRLNDRIIRHMIISLDEQVTILPPEPVAETPEGEAAEGEAPATEPTETAAEVVEAPAAEAAVAETEAPAAETEVVEAEAPAAETEVVEAEVVETDAPAADSADEEPVAEEAAEDESTKE